MGWVEIGNATPTPPGRQKDMPRPAVLCITAVAILFLEVGFMSPAHAAPDDDIRIDLLAQEMLKEESDATDPVSEG